MVVPGRVSRRLAVLGLLTVIMIGAVLAADRPGQGLDDMARDRGRIPRIVAGAVNYSGARQLDVYALEPRQGGRPVVVLVHACCGDRADLGQLAEAVAAAGAVAINADWAGIKPGARFPDAYADVACAVRFARAHAVEYGGNPDDVTLLGWSDGAMVSAVVGAAGDQLERTGCRAPEHSGVPDAVVGVAGFYGWTLPPDPVYVNDRARTFLGGTPRTAARAWRDATPYGWLTTANGRCATLVVGATDPLLADAERYAAALRRAGQAPRLVVEPPAGDQSMISTRTEEGRTTVREVLSATNRCRGLPSFQR